MMRRIALLAIAMTWCAVAQASDAITPTHCQQRELSNKDLVLCGMATPEDILFRVPELIDAERFMRSLEKTFGPWKQIGDHLYAIRLKDAGSTLEEKAQNVDDKLRRLNSAKSIRMNPLFIPEPLKGTLSPEDIAVLENQKSAKASIVPAVDLWREANAEPNLILYALATPPPQDPGYAMQCGLKAINAEKAWDTFQPDAPNVKIAIVDSGVDKTHPDLYGNAKTATDDDVDRNGHGTHLAGIIGGISDDAFGIVGVTWKTNITAFRFLDRAGRGTLEDAIPKLEAAIDLQPHIILLAWGVGAKSKDSMELERLLRGAHRVLFVAAAGNSGQDTDIYPVYPASFRGLNNMISVMATTCDDIRPRFSNFGATTVDLAAPGEGLGRDLRIYSTVLNHQWGHLAGTSMAAAFVAGAAALVFEQNPSATPQQVKCWLTKTVTPLPGLKNAAGGRLDLAGAVKPLDTTKCP
jgi:subtilisin family serine protease